MTLPETRTCDQCGRVGVRGFKVVGRQGPWDRRGVHYFVLCASETACRKRWTRVSEDDK